MNISRRKLLLKLGQGTAYMALIASLPKVAWAKWNEKAFVATELQTAITAKYGVMPISDSDKVKLKAPCIAENGAVVPVTISSTMDNVKSMSLFVEHNPSPLVTSFNLGKGSVASVSVRIRMGKTSDIIALVEADGKLYRTKKAVKVTIGGCGG
jgi:sulfur-oxidizing protein SoxY